MLPLEVLVLLSVFASGTKGATSATVAAKAKPFGASTVGHGGRADLIATIEALHTGGDLDKTSGKVARYTLTMLGREHLESAVGALPAKATWASLRDTLLLPAVVGASRRAKPTFGLVRSFVIAQALVEIDGIAPAKTESDVLNRLASILVGAARPDPTVIKNAIIEKWLSESTSTRRTSEGIARPEAPAARTHAEFHAIDYAAFARDVVTAARSSLDVGIGKKAFISRVWLRMQRDATTRELDERSFKEALLEANRRRLLSLSRADLSISFDPTDVRASEITWHGDTFHFVETER